MKGDNIFVTYFIPLALLISLGLGISPIVQKYVLNSWKIHPDTIIIMCWILASIILLPYSVYNWKRVRADFPKFNKPVVITVAVVGVLFGLLSTILYFKLITHNNTSAVVALVYSSPIFTLILAYLLLNENISLKGAIGILMIVSGVVLLSMSKK